MERKEQEFSSVHVDLFEPNLNFQVVFDVVSYQRLLRNFSCQDIGRQALLMD